MPATLSHGADREPRGSMLRAWGVGVLAAMPAIALLALIGLANESNEAPGKGVEVFFGGWLLLVAVGTYRAARRRGRGRGASLAIGVSSVLTPYVIAILAFLLFWLIE